ncbi:unnamed protein product [Penicillium salamii]|uniref:FAD-binding PCMH-type domain-containing protein n=1 Tax=Penicillium salamii TaxID=1612424 RepID=A0A9W4IRX0_9EURO|nr:unnamed protein product [Penicillium salamii]CAG8013856.1 unnamed protein product [Penicillium salamii]CAG8021132.1 unnamed protein product [Penicillium salamii]CAG8307370.1 unnamed protein product [Penicillium salamii]CAG8329332.1 unnamed protein product [Penicillium salamii]
MYFLLHKAGCRLAFVFTRRQFLMFHGLSYCSKPIDLMLQYLNFFPVAFLVLTATAKQICKVSPSDLSWPSQDAWNSLNQSIQGTLIRTAPVGSSCYSGNPFNSPENCTVVKNHWSSAAYHAAWPESIDYSIYANNSCLPPGVDGYSAGKDCSIGGLPQYIVNASTEHQVATAMKWASHRDIRIVVKGTGHDLGGRSTGAFALSIWTHNFKRIQVHPKWNLPGTNDTADVVLCGSGNNWGDVYNAVHKINRTVVGGEDATVGLGGLIQNGGHGLLSSHYGLASDQVYQVTVVTTQGQLLVANDVQNQDLFWAVRGAGGGQYGVITEFVLRTHPVPENVVTGGFSFYPSQNSKASEIASWNSLAEVAAQIPDLMDSGLTGTVTALNKQKAVSYMGLKQEMPGVSGMIGFTGFNMTIELMNASISKLVARLDLDNVNITLQSPSTKSYWDSTKPDPSASNAAGSVSLMTSQLLGRSELSDISRERLVDHLQRIMVSQNSTAGTMLLFGLQAGKGPAGIPEIRRGSTLPAWRESYVHAMAYSASIDAIGDPSRSLKSGADWINSAQESAWKNWAPQSGSYMNEGNPFSINWKHDFYGANYERLLKVKRKYDPSGSLFVWSGVGSNEWDYNLNSGLLCRV